MSLIHLAMNPNLTPEQFKECAELHVAGFKRMCDEVTKGMERLPPEHRVEFFSTVFPILMGMM